jgi:NAD(P)-dependent dehydrogenase (short-subunit alcohol dehydrogenase family)
MRLTGKRALVTGSSKGIGAEIARRLAGEGADVVVNYNSDKAGGEAVADEIRKLGRRGLAVKADVGVSAEARNLAAEAIKFLGGIDILVNNAGITPWSPFLDTPEEVWDRTINSNLKSMFIVGQAAARNMAERKWGRIVNISSGAGRAAFPNAVHYNASKGGVNMLTLGMAGALGRLGITVNAVAPGAIVLERTLRDNPQYSQEWGRLTPVPRAGTTQDVAAVVAWLCTPEAEFVTGQVLYTDGGLFSAAVWPRNPDGSFKAG